MVVEDDEELNEVICYNLAKAGYEAIPVRTGVEAIARLESERPDLILLDVMLPQISGWDVCQHIAEDRAMADLPVVVFTAKSARADFDRARSFPNFAGYFVKPYALKDVMRHIERIFSDE